MRSEAWRPAAAARNRSPREAGTPPSRHYDLAVRGARSTDPGHAGEGSAAPGEKPPRWSAERRASRVISAFTRVLTRHGTQGASQAPGVSRHDTPHGCLARTRTFLGAPPTLDSGERSKVANPGRKTAPRERDGLFEK